MPDTKSDPVQLGCGTLILIALIVLIFSGGPTKDLQGDIDDLAREVVVLQEKIDDLAEAVEEIHDAGVKRE